MKGGKENRGGFGRNLRGDETLNVEQDRQGQVELVNLFELRLSQEVLAFNYY